MIKLMTGTPGSGSTFQSSSVGEKPKSIGWQNVHALAIQSMAIVVGRKPVPKAWAFKVEVVDFGAGARGGACENGGAPAEVSTIPGGNYGDNLTGVRKSE